MDKEFMTGVVEQFLALPPAEQMLYQVGRRTGMFSGLDELEEPHKREGGTATCIEFRITPDNVNEAIDELMKRFI